MGKITQTRIAESSSNSAILKVTLHNWIGGGGRIEKSAMTGECSSSKNI